MAIFYRRIKKGKKVLIKYNLLLPFQTYLTILFLIMLFTPLILSRFTRDSDTVEYIFDLGAFLLTRFFLLSVFFYLISLLDYLLIWGEVRKAMKKGGVVIKGSRYSLKNPISYEYEEET